MLGMSWPSSGASIRTQCCVLLKLSPKRWQWKSQGFSRTAAGEWRQHRRSSSLSTYRIMLWVGCEQAGGWQEGTAASTGVNGAGVLRTRHKTKALTLGGCPDPRSVTLLVRAAVITTLGQPPIITCLGNYFSQTVCAKCHILSVQAVLVQG